MAAPSVNYAKAAAMAPQPAAPMPQQHQMQPGQMPPQQSGMPGQQGGDWRANAQAPPKDNRLKTTVRPAPAARARPAHDPCACAAPGALAFVRNGGGRGGELTAGPAPCAGCHKH